MVNLRIGGSIKNIIGRSEKMQAVYQMIETVAEVQSTILVTGESGTGKELVAHAIHDLSPRAELLQMSVRSLRHLLDKHEIQTLSAQMRSSD